MAVITSMVVGILVVVYFRKEFDILDTSLSKSGRYGNVQEDIKGMWILFSVVYLLMRGLIASYGDIFW